MFDLKCKGTAYSFIKKAGKHPPRQWTNHLSLVTSLLGPLTDGYSPMRRKAPVEALSPARPARNFHPVGLSVDSIGLRPDDTPSSMVRKHLSGWPFTIARAWATTHRLKICSDCEILAPMG